MHPIENRCPRPHSICNLSPKTSAAAAANADQPYLLPVEAGSRNPPGAPGQESANRDSPAHLFQIPLFCGSRRSPRQLEN